MKEKDTTTKIKQNISFLSMVTSLIRILSLFFYGIISVPIFWIFFWVRFFHPLFRKLGVQNGNLPLDKLQQFWARSILSILGVHVKIDVPFQPLESTVLMYSHASNLDPFIIMGWGPFCKFIFKRSLLYSIPPVFVIAKLYGHIPIDRTNRDSAINSLSQAGKQMAKFKRSISISPEGTRSLTGKLQEFKKGPFYLAKGAGVPITPVVLFGNYDLWPPGQLFPLSGDVVVRFLPPIVPTQDDTAETLSHKVHEAMEKELQLAPEIKYSNPNRCGSALLWLGFSLFLLYNFWTRILFTN